MCPAPCVRAPCLAILQVVPALLAWLPYVFGIWTRPSHAFPGTFTFMFPLRKLGTPQVGKDPWPFMPTPHLLLPGAPKLCKEEAKLGCVWIENGYTFIHFW